MRNLERIPRILEKIEAIWINEPDTRLGQLLVNFAPPRMQSDIFYFEDDNLEVELDKKIEKIMEGRGK